MARGWLAAVVCVVVAGCGPGTPSAPASPPPGIEARTPPVADRARTVERTPPC